MSRTYRKEHHSRLFSNGERGHHNTLLKEFKGILDGYWICKDGRNLIPGDRYYQSDRMKRMRIAAGKRRRRSLKQLANLEIQNYYQELL